MRVSAPASSWPRPEAEAPSHRQARPERAPQTSACPPVSPHPVSPPASPTSRPQPTTRSPSCVGPPPALSPSALAVHAHAEIPTTHARSRRPHTPSLRQPRAGVCEPLHLISQPHCCARLCLVARGTHTPAARISIRSLGSRTRGHTPEELTLLRLGPARDAVHPVVHGGGTCRAAGAKADVGGEGKAPRRSRRAARAVRG